MQSKVKRWRLKTAYLFTLNWFYLKEIQRHLFNSLWLHHDVQKKLQTQFNCLLSLLQISKLSEPYWIFSIQTLKTTKNIKPQRSKQRKLLPSPSKKLHLTSSRSARISTNKTLKFCSTANTSNYSKHRKVKHFRFLGSGRKNRGRTSFDGMMSFSIHLFDDFSNIIKYIYIMPNLMQLLRWNYCNYHQQQLSKQLIQIFRKHIKKLHQLMVGMERRESNPTHQNAKKPQKKFER